MILFSLYRLFPDKTSAKPRSNRQLQIKIPTKLDRIGLKSRRAQNAAVKGYLYYTRKNKVCNRVPGAIAAAAGFRYNIKRFQSVFWTSLRGKQALRQGVNWKGWD